jgi:hypothetical protein
MSKMALPWLKNEKEVIELLYNSEDKLSDTSDNEVDDVAVADAIINNDSGDEDEICNNYNFIWEGTDNYRGKRENFCGECGPRNGAENVKNILDCFQLFFDKEIIEHIVTETNRYAEQ